MVIENAEQSAALIRSILDGEPGPARDIVVANAAAALWLSNNATTLKDGAVQAQQAIDDGAAQKLLAKLVELTNAN